MGRTGLNFDEIITLEVKEKIPTWKAEGYTDEWIAVKLGIGLTTLKKWKRERSDFKKIFEEGREKLAEQIEGSMFSLALGKKIVLKETKDSDKNGVEVKETEKYIQSTDMIRLALATLKPEKYSRKVLEGREEDNKGGTIIFGGEEELDD